MTSGRVRLTVDGEEVALIDTMRLFQRDPFPGGHRYSLVIGDSSAVRIAASSAPSTSEQQAALWTMDRLAAGEPGEPAVPARYLLNSVDVIRPLESGFVIEGICSLAVETD